MQGTGRNVIQLRERNFTETSQDNCAERGNKLNFWINFSNPTQPSTHHTTKCVQMYRKLSNNHWQPLKVKICHVAIMYCQMIVMEGSDIWKKEQSLKRNQTNPGCKQNRIRFYNVGIMVVMRLRHPDDVNRNNASLAASLFLCLFMSKFSHFLYYNYDVVKIRMKNDENGLILIIRVLLTLTITQGTSLQALLVNMTMKIMRSWILNFFYHN